MLRGFSIGGYRSFLSPPETVSPLGKVNLVVGQNNSGKSNVLRFATQVLPSVRTAQASNVGSTLAEPIPLTELDKPLGTELTVRVGLAGSAAAIQSQIVGRLTSYESYLDEAIDRIADDDGLAWFRLILVNPQTFGWDGDELSRLAGLGSGCWNTIADRATGTSGGDPTDQVRRGLQVLWSEVEQLPPSVSIPAIRKIGTQEGSPDDLSGATIIATLAEYQHPAALDTAKKQKFKAIRRFVQAVLDEPTADIEIPLDRSTINVELRGNNLPIESLGTGIHEVTMLAAYATLHDDHLVCIEEPELHLHPLLQRKLLRYLATETTNQYLLSTHSAHILGTAGATVLHVRHSGEGSSVEVARASGKRVQVCEDLGYSAADLLQANCVIWVEGPTDRLYLRHWITAVGADLEEGIHYSVMFYGGRLLSHLSADDEEIEDFISLRKLNQHLSIVMDSDRASEAAEVNATKQRVANELTDNGIAWITAGREIENYLQPDLREVTLSNVVREPVKLVSDGAFGPGLAFRRPDGSEVFDTARFKLPVAHAVIAEPPDLGVLDLSDRVEELVEFIRQANGPVGPSNL